MKKAGHKIALQAADCCRKAALGQLMEQEKLESIRPVTDALADQLMARADKWTRTAVRCP